MRRFILMAEGGFELRAPSPEDIAEAAEALDPRSGCGFMSLEEMRPNGSGDYVQAAGGRVSGIGRSRVTVERRIYPADWNGDVDAHPQYQHLVAGYPGRSAATAASIATNGFQVTVRANEVLSTPDIVAIMTAFLTSRDLPAAYRWRSNREEVDQIVRDTKAGLHRH